MGTLGPKSPTHILKKSAFVDEIACHILCVILGLPLLNLSQFPTHFAC